MPKILEGIRAIEWAWMVAGPTAGYVLGDLGADVIKIEEPGLGTPDGGSTATWAYRLACPTTPVPTSSSLIETREA